MANSQLHRNGWTCAHGVTYSGSGEFISGARNAHHEYEQAMVRREPEGAILGFVPRLETDPWTVRRCPIHELVVTEDDRCPVLLVGQDAVCGVGLSEPFQVRECRDA